MARGKAVMAAELAGEVKLAGVAAIAGDLGHTLGGAAEVLGGHFQPALIDPFHRLEAGLMLEDAAKVNRAQFRGCRPVGAVTLAGF